MSHAVRLAVEQHISSLARLIPASVRALGAGHYTYRQIESALVHIFGVDSQLIAVVAQSP